MIREDYVSVETAKLLKEKGFDEPVLFTIDREGFQQYPKNLEFEYLHNSEVSADEYACPTLQMVMRWLRDVHNMYVFPFPQMNTNKFWVEIYQLSNNQKWENLYCETIDLQDYSFYEEACEAGIRYCLENLI